MGVREGGWDKGTELGAQHNLLPNLWQLPEICFVRNEGRKEGERERERGDGPRAVANTYIQGV